MRSPRTTRLASPCVFCGGERGIRSPDGFRCAACHWPVGTVPDLELPPPRIDVVYYLRFRDRVKIGTTANPRQRFAAIRHDELLALEQGDRRREHERHLQFAADRLEQSEWFTLTPRLTRHIATLRTGSSDPWQLHLRWMSEAYSSRC